MKTRCDLWFCLCILFLYSANAISQDKRAQYPPGLSNSYIGVNIGYINYPFSSVQLEPGFNVGSVKIPHTAVRIQLYGLEINPYLSAQITYMRPVGWVEYKNVNGDQSDHSVWMNVAGASLTGRLPFNKKFSVLGEAGFALITRKGFKINGVDAVKDANYGSMIAGGTLQYHLNRKWDLQAGVVWSPEKKKEKQPHTIFYSAGFNYHMRPLPKEIVERNANNGLKFPKNMLMLGYSTNSLGYGVNNAVSKGPVPIFWGGDVKIERGFLMGYQRNIFRARRVFAFDWGVNFGFWKSRDQEDNFITLSLYPVMRFTAWRTKPLDLYFEYSVAGPTYISKTIIDGKETGRKFTFQDFMGMGVFAGKEREFNFGIRVAHYSNGNLFPRNDGLMIPLTFNLGYNL